MLDDDRKAKYRAMKWPELADLIANLQENKKTYEGHISGINQHLEFITKDVIPDRMVEEGLRGVPLADGSRIELRQKAYCSTRAGMKEALFEWMQANGFEELITEVINPGTLKSFIKEQLDEGNEVPPDDVVNYQPFLQATLVGRKG